MNNITPTLLTDGYKIDHRRQYPEETVEVDSNFTPRKSRIEGIFEVLVFGPQFYILNTLIEVWNSEFFNKPWEEIDEEFMNEMTEYTLSRQFAEQIGTSHWKKLHDLGYLPLEIRALPEGSLCPIKVPCYLVRSTHDDFYWLTNFIETDMSAETWGPMTSATLAYQYKKIFTKWAKKTGGDLGFIPFQGHDFSYRGMFGRNAAILSGMGHLTSFVGTDTIPAIKTLKKYYGANVKDGIIGCSVFATEHAVMCVGTGFYIKKNNLDWERYGEAEFEVFKRLITEVYPTGIVSIVSDTWDLWKVLLEYIVQLKEEILARDGKLVIRPDSGDPIEILCGTSFETIDVDSYEEFIDAAQDELHNLLVDKTPHGECGGDIDGFYKWNGKHYKVTYSPDWNRYDKQYYYIDNFGSNKTEAVEFELTAPQTGVVELLWNVFGGTTTVGEDGNTYKLLNPKIGCIYGDSITTLRADKICERLAAKGFASTNWVAGIGSFTYQYNTRDTFGFAMKATYAEVMIDGARQGIEIFKDPVTDDGTKKSLKGLIAVFKDENGKYYAKDQATREEVERSEMPIVFLNGKLVVHQNLSEIRDRINSHA